jgi:hypothetical protein
LDEKLIGEEARIGTRPRFKKNGHSQKLAQDWKRSLHSIHLHREFDENDFQDEKQDKQVIESTSIEFEASLRSFVKMEIVVAIHDGKSGEFESNYSL